VRLSILALGLDNARSLHEACRIDSTLCLALSSLSSFFCFRTDGVSGIWALGDSKPSLCFRLEGDLARSFTADERRIPAGELPLGVVEEVIVAILALVGVRSRSTVGRERDGFRVRVSGRVDSEGAMGESANSTLL